MKYLCHYHSPFFVKELYKDNEAKIKQTVYQVSDVLIALKNAVNNKKLKPS